LSVPDQAPLIGRVGPLISRERTGRGLSIEQLAKRAGISAGLLSQLERGIGNPSLDTLAGLAAALSVPIGSFFDGPDGQDRNAVIHPASRKRLFLSDHGLTYQLLVPDTTGALAMLYIELPPGFSNVHTPFVHPGEEAVYVMTGRITLHTGGRSYDLRSGDSIKFAPGSPHWYETYDDPVTVITAMTPPSF
jgi:transcriptional regulator with XRE-family HTH domain